MTTLEKNLLQKQWSRLDNAVEQAKILESVISTNVNPTTNIQNVIKSTRNFNNSHNNVQKMSACNSFGAKHLRNDYKFRDASCYICHQKGHISNVCRSKIKQSNTRRDFIKSTNFVESTTFEVLTVKQISNEGSRKILIPVNVNK